jgi:hypothetical protein
MVEAVSGLPDGMEWAEAENIPIFGNQISVRQTGRFKTQLKNSAGSGFTWRASFPGTHRKLLVDGTPRPARTTRRVNGVVESYVLALVAEGSSKVVEAVRE